MGVSEQNVISDSPYRNGTYKSYVYPSATFTEFDAVNGLGDRVGDTITGNVNGFLWGPAFLLKCR